jgi:hypothetical protein
MLAFISLPSARHFAGAAKHHFHRCRPPSRASCKARLTSPISATGGGAGARDAPVCGTSRARGAAPGRRGWARCWPWMAVGWRCASLRRAPRRWSRPPRRPEPLRPKPLPRALAQSNPRLPAYLASSSLDTPDLMTPAATPFFQPPTRQPPASMGARSLPHLTCLRVPAGGSGRLLCRTVPALAPGPPGRTFNDPRARNHPRLLLSTFFVGYGFLREAFGGGPLVCGSISVIPSPQSHREPARFRALAREAWP